VGGGVSRFYGYINSENISCWKTDFIIRTTLVQQFKDWFVFGVKIAQCRFSINGDKVE
jgi:hypothetical protein